ncbi:MAG: creatininase family protein, partial [Armatimonadetes bacterium]|nr:creatininase family protein [Armatimonadota bacterium]
PPPEYLSAFGHAGNIETSYLWASEPDCVDMSRLPTPDAPGPHFAMGSDARQAERRIGEAVVAVLTRNLAELGRKLLTEADGVADRPEPMTYEQVEALWDSEMRPVFSDFACMQALKPGQPAPREGSRWRRNWAVPDRS